MWELITSRQELAALQPEWESLYAKNPRHSPFLAWGWMNAWLLHLSGNPRLMIACMRGSDKQLQYILPLVSDADAGNGGLHRTVLACSYGPDCSEELGCLCLPELEGRAAELTIEAISRSVDRGTIYLNPLGNITAFPSELTAALTAHGRVMRLRQDVRCPTIDLPDSWDDYLADLSSNFRSQIRRSAKAMTRIDGLGFRSLGPAEADIFTDALIKLNKQRMQSKGEVSTLEEDCFKRFLKEATPYMAKYHTAWMDVIERDDEILAAALNFVANGRVYYYMGGFQESISSIRPGVNLFARVIKRSIESKMKKYNFLRGEEPYKYRWNASDAESFNVTIFPEGRICPLAYAFMDDLRITARNLIRRKGK